MNQIKSLVRVVNNPAKDGVVRMVSEPFNMTFGLTEDGKIQVISILRNDIYSLENASQLFVPKKIYNKAAKITYAILKERRT